MNSFKSSYWWQWHSYSYFYTGYILYFFPHYSSYSCSYFCCSHHQAATITNVKSSNSISENPEQNKAINLCHSAAQQDALDKFFKAWNCNLYYGNLQIKYYSFCWECKSNFEIIGAKSYKCVSFTNPFFYGKINFCCQQYKTWIE